MVRVQSSLKNQLFLLLQNVYVTHRLCVSQTVLHRTFISSGIYFIFERIKKKSHAFFLCCAIPETVLLPCLRFTYGHSFCLTKYFLFYVLSTLYSHSLCISYGFVIVGFVNICESLAYKMKTFLF